MRTPIAVVLNTNSGSRSRNAHQQVVEALYRHQVKAQIMPAGGGSDVARYAAQAVADGYGTVIAAGGDGTVGTVAGQLVGTGVALGVLPMGTFNHFARDLGIPVDQDGAMHTLTHGTEIAVDVGQVNGRTFINNSSLGVYPKLVQEREHHRRLGYTRWLALLAALLATARRYKQLNVHLQVGDQDVWAATPFVFVGNNVYTLEGARLGSRSHLDLGILCACVAHRAGRWHLLKMAFQAFTGTLVENSRLDLFCAPEVRVETRRRRVSVSLDGEITWIEAPLHYRVLPKSLLVIGP